MSGYGYKEARISQERRPRVYYCGECGTEVRSNEFLCEDCARANQTGDLKGEISVPGEF